MSIKRTSLVLLSLACLAGPVSAADPAPASPPAQPTAGPGTGPGPGMGMGMRHGGGMKCPMHDKMKHRAHGGQVIMVPRLPPGNEKLQLQMHAEILQKVGEIEAKYAAQLP
ncbi:MAG: hypothetical protein AB7Q01_12765 [Gammaproteobacteria bacterium]